MENDSSLSATVNESVLLLLPTGAVAFAPFLVLELVAVIASNAILLALVILACVKKLNNNINIYLFSLAIGGLIGAFNIFCLLAIVVARRWTFDFVLCNISRFVTTIYNIFFLLIYFVISRDKLKGVKDPLRGRPTSKRAYINSTIVWVTSTVLGLILFVPWIWTWRDLTQIPNLFVERGNFICFGFTSRRADDRIRLVLTSFFVSIFWVISSIIIIITFSNFVRILKELRELKNLRLRYAHKIQTGKVFRINRRDKPLYHTGEERTAKSLTLVYFIQFSCVFVSYAMGYIQIIRNSVLSPENKDGPDYQIYFVVLLIIQFFPCINPIFLILSNKRLSKRVKELFKCTLNPEVEASPVHMSTNWPKKGDRVVFDLKTNKIAPL